MKAQAILALQRNRKTNNTERRNGDPTEAKSLNVKKPNTNDQRKWRQVQKPRKRVHYRNVIMMTLGANIAPDEEFKGDISWIRKDAERNVLGSLVKFHDRGVQRSKSRLVKPEQEPSREERNVR